MSSVSDLLQLPGLDGERDPVRTIQIGGLPVRVEVVRSPRRHRTVSARPHGEVLRIAIPAAMSLRQEDRWVREMAKRHVRSLASATIDLEARADSLSRRYDLPQATSVRWVDMDSQWGSCTMAGTLHPHRVTRRQLPVVGARLPAGPRARPPRARRPLAGVLGGRGPLSAGRTGSRLPHREERRRGLATED